MEIKVLHCSDIHLDCPCSGIWEKGNQRRQEQREIFARIVSMVPTHQIDALLIAGDLFDLDTLNPPTVAYVKDLFKSIDPVPVFISPGNKDPFSPDSPYAYPDWPPNVSIFNTNRFKSKELKEHNVFIYGAANKTSDDTCSALMNLSLKKKEGVHIVLFHGTYMPGRPAEKVQCLPFSAEDIEKCRAHYLALGHFHERQCLENDCSRSRTHYCGAPEFMSFGEIREKGVIIATISQDKAVTTFFPTWKRRFIREEIDCSLLKNTGDVIEVIRRLAEKEGYGDAILQIAITGSLNFDLIPQKDKIQEALAGHFFSFSLKDETFPAFTLKRLRDGRTSMAAFASRVEEEFYKTSVNDKRERTLLACAVKSAFEAFSASRKDTP